MYSIAGKEGTPVPPDTPTIGPSLVLGQLVHQQDSLAGMADSGQKCGAARLVLYRRGR